MTVMSVVKKRARAEYAAFLEKSGELTEETEEKKTYRIEAQHFQEGDRLSRELERLGIGCTILPQSFIVSLVSQYDLFLGRLMNALFTLRPDLLNVSEKQLSFAQLLSFTSIDDARRYILEKETETLIRCSHAEQFGWLENKFSIKLREHLDAWPCFVELTERRNLFVHTGGTVSSQYLQVCCDHKVPLPGDCRVGDKLCVDRRYFADAYACVFEIGVKLSQVLWRKLLPDALGDADECLNDILYDLLATEQFKLAVTTGKFANEVLKKHSSDEVERRLRINWAQAYRWQGNSDRCGEILSQVDWSACSLSFKFAVAVLKDDHTAAVALMKQIGDHGEVTEDHYKTWPLFREFRRTDVFQQTFEEVFGHPITEMAESDTAAAEAQPTEAQDNGTPTAPVDYPGCGNGEPDGDKGT